MLSAKKRNPSTMRMVAPRLTIYHDRVRRDRRFMLKCLLVMMVCTAGFAQQTKLRIIAFGAHPDDCDLKFGGTAAKFAKAGHAVKFVSVTNGDVGHQTLHGAELARRRQAEAKESGRRLGIAEYEVLT